MTFFDFRFGCIQSGYTTDEGDIVYVDCDDKGDFVQVVNVFV